MQRREYPSDLSEREWAILDRTGGQWRALPHDFPPWSTVWSYFRSFRNDGTWKHMHIALREKTRVKQAREPTPSAAIIARPISEDKSKRGRRGDVLGKRVKGRKRHVLVDTNGFLLHVLVHEANIPRSPRRQTPP